MAMERRYTGEWKGSFHCKLQRGDKEAVAHMAGVVSVNTGRN
jgi:hypothetical protein